MRSTGPRLLVLVTAVLLLPGCGDDKAGVPDGLKLDLGSHGDRGPIPDGVVAVPDGLTLPDGLPHDPDGPTLEIQEPQANKIVLGDVMLVRAKISDPDGVDPSTVKVTIDAQTHAMTATATLNIYEAKVDVSSLGTSILLYITAQDLLGHGNTSQLLTLERDAGPTITVLSPTEGSYHKGSLPVQVIVTDKGTITTFEARIGQVVLTQLVDQEQKPKKQTWVGTVKFDDSMFGTGLKGTQVLTLTATNANKATAKDTRTFIIDEQGPDIVIKSHAAGELVGGVIKLGAEVSDQAGVIQASVKAVIGNNLVQRTVLLTAAKGSKLYEGQFDTRTLSQYDLWPVVSFRATDLLGNESHQEIQVGLDNGQPIIELDPSADFHMVREKDKLFECSQPFDPVGPLAANDKQRVPQIYSLRARIEDQGNHVMSALWVPISGVDPATVWAYILDDTTKALVVDTTGDGYCDSINPDVIPIGSTPTKGEAVAVNLTPVSPAGGADFTPVANLSPPGYCDKWGAELDPPKTLCKGVLATIAQPYSTSSTPAIYTIAPVVPGDTFKCLGLPFDYLANTFDDGWVCAAAAASDELGNAGVSPPIRLYVDKSAFGPGPGPAGEPNCTGTLDKTTGAVDTTKPCKFRDVRSSSYAANSSCSHDKCSNCAGYVCPIALGVKELEFPQTFCHCAGLLP